MDICQYHKGGKAKESLHALHVVTHIICMPQFLKVPADCKMLHYKLLDSQNKTNKEEKVVVGGIYVLASLNLILPTKKWFTVSKDNTVDHRISYSIICMYI